MHDSSHSLLRQSAIREPDLDAGTAGLARFVLLFRSCAPKQHDRSWCRSSRTSERSIIACCRQSKRLYECKSRLGCQNGDGVDACRGAAFRQPELRKYVDARYHDCAEHWPSDHVRCRVHRRTLALLLRSMDVAIEIGRGQRLFTIRPVLNQSDRPCDLAGDGIGKMSG